MKTKILGFLVLALLVLPMLACGNYYIEIPAGYVGRILTPTGWDDNILEAGQVDLGQKDNAGRYSTLVLLEVTTTTVKEQFLDNATTVDREDHRVLTKGGTPLAVDMYVRLMQPDDRKIRNNIFVQVTPKPYANDPRVKVITLEDVYDRFARMDVRGQIRSIFAEYDDYQDVYKSYGEVNTKIADKVLKTFEANSVPLRLQNAQLSNVKPDAVIWNADNQKAAATSAASAIKDIGAAMSANPGYGEYLKWTTLQKIAESGGDQGRGTNTIIITDEGSSDQTPWAAAEYVRQQLQPKQEIQGPPVPSTSTQK